MLEFQQFNTLWDQKFREYDERAAELLDAMRQRHLLDQDEVRKGVEAGPAHRPKASKELLDLRRKQVMVAKQGDYADAQKLKTRADALEAEEAERREREAEQHALLAEVKFMRRQEQEPTRCASGSRRAPRSSATRASSTSSGCSSGTRTSRASSRRSRPPSATGRRRRRRPGPPPVGFGLVRLRRAPQLRRRHPAPPASAARGATPASRAPGFSAARTPAPPKWR